MTDRGFSRATKRSAQFPRTPRRTVLTGLGRGARFAIRLRLFERTSFDARVYNQTSSHYKTLLVSRSWVLGERHIAKALSNDVVRRRTEVACLWSSAHGANVASPGGKKPAPISPWGKDGGAALTGHPGSRTTHAGILGQNRPGVPAWELVGSVG